jgi:hypothetical protein
MISSALKAAIFWAMVLVVACGGGGNSVEILSTIDQELNSSVAVITSIMSFVIN